MYILGFSVKFVTFLIFAEYVNWDQFEESKFKKSSSETTGSNLNFFENSPF